MESQNSNSIFPLRPSNGYLVTGNNAEETRQITKYLQKQEDRETLFISTNSTPEEIREVYGEDTWVVDCRQAEVETGEKTLSINSPSDLTGIGVAVSKWLKNGNEGVVIFDSLATLSMYHDMEDIFRFVHILLGRVKDIDSSLICLSRKEHDDELNNVLSQLFDSIIDMSSFSIRNKDGQQTVNLEVLSEELSKL